MVLLKDGYNRDIAPFTTERTLIIINTVMEFPPKNYLNSSPLLLM